MYPVFGGAGSFSPAGRLQGSHLGPPGRGLRSRVLAGGAAEHRLFRGVVSAAPEGQQRLHAATLGLSLRYRSVCFLPTGFKGRAGFETHQMMTDTFFLCVFRS